MHIDALEGMPADVGVQTPVAVVEVDTFCLGCGHNLHQQVIARDELLDILVTQCPGCGKFAAATALTGVSHRVVNRLAVGTLRIYVLIVVCFGTLITIFLGGFQSEYVWQLRRTGVLSEQAILFLATPVTFAFVTGSLIASFMWHWKAWGWRLAGLMPLLISALGLGMRHGFRAIPSSDLEFTGTALAAFIDCLALGLGLWLGRRIARLVLRFVLPPRVRQKFAFLWFVDGKTLPKATAAVLRNPCGDAIAP